MHTTVVSVLERTCAALTRVNRRKSATNGCRGRYCCALSRLTKYISIFYFIFCLYVVVLFIFFDSRSGV